MKTVTYKVLTYLGSLPFLFCVYANYTHIHNIPYIGPVSTFLQSYTLVIAAFLCGIHWGQHLQSEKPPPINLFILSNIIVLLLWFLSLLLPLNYFIRCAAALFALLLITDFYLFYQKFITRDYYRVRCYITTIVVFCLSIINF